MNSESSFKFREKNAPSLIGSTFLTPQTCPKFLQDIAQGTLHWRLSPHPTGTCHQTYLAGVFLSRTVFFFGHGKDACFPMSVVWSLVWWTFLLKFRKKHSHPLSFHHRVFMWNCETIAAIAREKEKTVLTGKTAGVSDSYRHTCENFQHGTPKFSPSITPFVQTEISSGSWFTLFSKSTFHLSHKRIRHRDSCLPFLSPFDNQTHRTSKHIIQSNGGAPEMALLPSAGTKEMVWPGNTPGWLTPKQLGFPSVIFKNDLFQEMMGEKKTKGLMIQSGQFMINPKTWMFRPFWALQFKVTNPRTWTFRDR